MSSRARIRSSPACSATRAYNPWQRASIGVFKGFDPIGTLAPQREFYEAANQGVGRVDIRHELNEGLYVNFAGVDADHVPVV